MARWSAPENISGITLTSGPLTVLDGHVEAPDDLSFGDRAGLRANGFVEVADETAAPAPEAYEAAPAEVVAEPAPAEHAPEPAPVVAPGETEASDEHPAV